MNVETGTKYKISRLRIIYATGFARFYDRGKQNIPSGTGRDVVCC